MLSGLVGLGALGVIFRLFRNHLLRYISISLLVLVGLELLLVYVPLEFLGFFWWHLHFPSIIALGADEILERHGWLVSTVWHAGDLLLWSLMSGAIIFFIKFPYGTNIPEASEQLAARDTSRP